MTGTLYLTLIFAPVAILADEASLRADLKHRLQAAFEKPGEAARKSALKAIFYQEGVEETTLALLDRTVQRLLDGNRRNVDFAPLPQDLQLVNVRNGYEYRPNLKPAGYIVLTSPDDPPGNDTRIFYGKPPGEDRYYIPAVVRKLANPDRPVDKQLQIIVVGIGHPSVKFRGWCDVELSNGSTRRVSLQDNDAGNQTRVLLGQKIIACELSRISDHGTLSLRLLEDRKELFRKRIATDADTLHYP